MDPITISAIVGGVTSIASGVISSKNKPEQPRYNPLLHQEKDNTAIVGITVFVLILILVIGLIFILKQN